MYYQSFKIFSFPNGLRIHHIEDVFVLLKTNTRVYFFSLTLNIFNLFV